MSVPPPPPPVQHDLPAAAHAGVDSMLSRKFGKEVANYFSGASLNRLSFLRTDRAFLSAAFRHPSAAFMLLDNLAPLAHDRTRLAYVSAREIRPIAGDDPFSRSDEEKLATFDSRRTIPHLIFLGVDESPSPPTPTAGRLDGSSNGQPSSSPSSSPFRWKIYSGTPVFALDVTPPKPRGPAAEEEEDSSGSAIAEACSALISRKRDEEGLTFLEGRTHLNLRATEAAAYAEARSMIDWNARNPFCAGCGQRTLSANAGFKRVCPPTDAADDGSASGAERRQRPDCPTRRGISNLCFPRTDATIIVAVLSSSGRHVLLGRQSRFPPLWYSTLAGFLEPGESIEEAVRREVWEEAGIELGRVVLHSSQPWPYPASMMIGAVAQALPPPHRRGLGAPPTASPSPSPPPPPPSSDGSLDDEQMVSLQHDPELEDARWFGVDEVAEALRVGTGDLERIDQTHKDYKQGGLRLPPRTAIANRLIAAAISEWAGGDSRL